MRKQISAVRMCLKRVSGRGGWLWRRQCHKRFGAEGWRGRAAVEKLGDGGGSLVMEDFVS